MQARLAVNALLGCCWPISALFTMRRSHFDGMSVEEYRDQVINPWLEGVCAHDERAQAECIARRLEDGFKRKAYELDMSDLPDVSSLPASWRWSELTDLMLPDHVSLDFGTLRACLDLLLNAWVNSARLEKVQREHVANQIQEVLQAGSEVLNLADMGTITTLPSLIFPLLDTVQEVRLAGCTSLTTLPSTLPDCLTRLDLVGCVSLKMLPSRLPSHLVWLDLSSCASLGVLPSSLPDCLTELRLNHCFMLEMLPPLPARMEMLSLRGCTALKMLPESWPLGLRGLYVNSCTSLTALPSTLPNNLLTLEAMNCLSLTDLPSVWPASLQSLSLSGCTSLTTLPLLSNNLTILNLSGCASLRSLPASWPDSVRWLDLSGCISLVVLPAAWPNGLRWLNLRGCRALISLPAVSLPNVEVWGIEQRPVYSTEEYWLRRAAKPEHDIVRFREDWQRLKGEGGFNAFMSLLKRLSGKGLQNRIQASQVVEVMEEILFSSTLRAWIFEQAREADGDCHDRPLAIFYTIQFLARFGKLQREGTGIHAVIELAQGMLKIALLEEVALRVMRKQWEEGRRTSNAQEMGPNMGEALEMQLALSYQLGQELALPFQLPKPLYAQEIAQLNANDMKFALDYVNATMDDLPRQREGLIAQPVWILFLLSDAAFAQEIEGIKQFYIEKMNELEMGKDVLHREQADELMRQSNRAVNERYKAKTAEILLNLKKGPFPDGTLFHE